MRELKLHQSANLDGWKSPFFLKNGNKLESRQIFELKGSRRLVFFKRLCSSLTLDFLPQSPASVPNLGFR